MLTPGPIRSRLKLVVPLLLLAATLFCGCSGNDGPQVKRIIILTNAVSPFWDAADVGARNAGKDLKLEADGLRVVFEKNTKGIAGQIEKLRQYAGADDIAAIAISVTDPKSFPLMQEMRKLRKMGVKIITLDSDVDRGKYRDTRFAYIGTDNILGGKELGRCAKGLLPNGAKYASFVGYKGQANAIERNDGFKLGAGPKFTLTEFLGDEVDLNKARKNVRDAIDRNPGITCFVGIWSYNTPAIVQIVTSDAVNIRGKVKIVGFDAEPTAISAMAEGNVDALVVQNPYEMGYQSVKLLQAMLTDDQTTIDKMFPKLKTDKENGDIYNTGLKVVVPDTGSPLKKEMFDDTTKFLKLSEFQDWLKKYRLTGS